MTTTNNSTSVVRYFHISLPLLIGLLIYIQTLAYGNQILGDPDTYLHIAVGRWIIANYTVPHHGIFSLAMPDAPWVAHEWMAEVILAWLFDHFGWTGLVAATALCAAVALAILLRVLLRMLDPVHALIAVVLAYFLMLPHLLARPDIFALPILVTWSAALVAARGEGRAPRPWLALLMTFWANLHGGFMFGLGLMALFAGEAVIEALDRRRRLAAARAWALFGALSLGAVLITPFGIEGLLLPFRLTGMTYALSMLIEWRSSDFQSFAPLEVWILILLFSALSFGWRLSLSRVLMVLLLLHLSLQHRRFGEILGLVVPLLLAPSVGAHLRAQSVRSESRRVDRIMTELAKPAASGSVALAGLLAVALTAAIPREAIRPSDASTPAAAIAAVAAHHIEGPVLNDYGFGGYLIFSGLNPFIDGRAELYGDAFIRRYTEAVALTSGELPELLQQYGISWTLLGPSLPAVRLLDHLPGWRRLYADEVAVVHAREEAAAIDETPDAQGSEPAAFRRRHRRMDTSFSAEPGGKDR